MYIFVCLTPESVTLQFLSKDLLKINNVVKSKGVGDESVHNVLGWKEGIEKSCL